MVKGKTIADFGCGNGGLIEEIDKKFKNKVWGDDLHEDSVLDGSGTYEFVNGYI